MVIRAETAAEYEEQLNQAWQDHANCHLTKEKYARLKRQHDNCFPAIRDLENKLKREQGWRMAAESEKTEFEEKYKEMKQLHDTCPRTIQMIKDQCNSKIKEFPEVQFQLQMLRLEHSKCNGVIAGLRTQLEKVTHQECEKKFREYEERIKEAVQTHSKCDDLFLRYEQKLEKAKTIEVVEKEKTKRLARARRLVSTMLPTLGLVFISGPPQGVLVAEVKVNSAADFANIKVKDVICQVKGHNTKTKEGKPFASCVDAYGICGVIILCRQENGWDNWAKDSMDEYRAFLFTCIFNYIRATYTHALQCMVTHARTRRRTTRTSIRTFRSACV